MDSLAQQVGIAGAILLVALWIVLKTRPWEKQAKEPCLADFICKYDTEAARDIRDIRDGIRTLVTLIERNGFHS